MELNITYYGKLSEIVGSAQQTMEVECKTIKELVEVLISQYPQLAGISLKIAQNNSICSLDELITHRNIDIFPPFSGG